MITDTQLKDFEEFLKDLANSKKKMNIPSPDKEILGRVVSSLPIGIELLKQILEKESPGNYYEEIVRTLITSLEVEKSIKESEGDPLLVFKVFIDIDNKLKTDREVFRKYLSDGIKWWLSQNNIGEDNE